MIIKLSPVSPLSRDTTLQVFKNGDMLTINNVQFDFSQLATGSTLPEQAISCDFIKSPVDRIDGELVLRLDLPCWADSAEAARFPEDIINPEDGAVLLPGQAPGAVEEGIAGFIDWSQVITPDDKAKMATERLLEVVKAELGSRRAIADFAIAPLQDAVELQDVTEAETVLLNEWRRYRVALNRLPDQPGYPNEITWPVPPA